LKILITGNKGFIATHLIRRLNNDFPNCEIVGFEINNDPLDYKYEHYDIIFHLAAIARVVDCTEKPFDQATTSNINLTNILLKEFSFNKFIYSSSCVVYGNDPNIPIFTENDRLKPNSIYASQKYYSENIINLHLSNLNIPSVSLRFFNVYGPGQSELGNYPNVVAALIKEYKKTGIPLITGDGTQSRDFVYVSDVVDALIKSISVSRGNHIYNVCTNTEYDINYLSSLISNDKQYIPERKYDIYRIRGSYAKIFKELGWSPKISLDDGILKTLQYEKLNG